ncbi:hypothetical protein AVEN_35664-1 [Araneus ventricosus]|uniref:Uncharacterized protein n=1 Tax=Araneus ventricosus TaxID=182803 RepID=A0A4Y2GDU0_ARAVE|nr:hypothetical protein AVEN_35664-1 [Araneus ventricosus]
MQSVRILYLRTIETDQDDFQHTIRVRETMGERQLQFQSRYHMGRSLTLSLCLLVLAVNNGVAFTPWVALPGEYTPDVHHPLLPGIPPCRAEATNRSKEEKSPFIL